MASCNNDLLFPCTVSCNIPAISPCSLRSPCLPHTYAQLSLGSQRTRVVLHHPPFSLVRGNMYLSWNPHLRGRRPYQTVTADPTCFPAPYFHRCHGNVKFFRVLGAMQRQTDRHSVSFLLSLSTDWIGFSQCVACLQLIVETFEIWRWVYPGLNSLSVILGHVKNKQRNKRLNRGLGCPSVP